MINPSAFICEPIKFGTICSIYPPKVRDVVSNEELLSGFKLLSYTQDDLEDLFEKIKKEDGAQTKSLTPLEFLLVNAYRDDKFEGMLKRVFQAFIHENIEFSYEHKLIFIGDAKDLINVSDITKLRYLSEENFFDFQNLVRESMGVQSVEPSNPEDESNPVIARFRALSRKRERAARRARANGEKISLTAHLAAICCMGIGITPLNIGEMSYASLNAITTMYQQKEKYDTDIRSLMAGADPKKVKPKYWIREKSDLQEVQI